MAEENVSIPPWPTVGPLSCVHADTRAALDAALAQWQFRVFVLDGAGVVDKAGFLARVERDLPMPVGLRPGNWDALADCLWGGLAGVTEERVAIVWTDAESLLQASLQDFLMGVAAFTTLAQQVATTAHGFPHPIEACLFLIGHSPAFAPFATG